MAKYQSIVNELEAINGAVFQELCDKLLILENIVHVSFSRTGSHKTKQKTISGTPDSSFMLQDGTFIFNEVTTNTSNANKLKDDIHYCFDVTKSKVQSEDISTIILCYNWNINEAEQKELFELARTYNQKVGIQFYSLDRIAILLNTKYKDLVREYLHLPIDTGQVVSVDAFISEYDQKALQGISTSLSNKFHHREDEKSELLKSIKSSEYTIVSGSPGVGKTKLALETIKEFLMMNQSYYAFCISYKSCDLLEDLNLHLDPQKNYILFVDDANRNDRLRQIIGFKNSVRKGDLKIIMTVRDYALVELRRVFAENTPKIISISKLDDPHIVDIIESDPFKILNSDFQEAILSVAHGNVRIAIMAALYAKETQDLRALSELSDLFDKYYTTLISDSEEFESELNLKCLGLISFFGNIKYLEREPVESILNLFDITYESFADTIQTLDRLELIEINYGYVKIIEQNLSTYFFYRCFLKDKLLPFSSLLDNYFHNHESNFRETVIHSNNVFGYENAMNLILPDIRSYYSKHQNDHEKCLQLFGLFAYYMQIECIDFLYVNICNLPESENENYIVEYDEKKSTHPQDGILKLISLLLEHPINEFSDILSLAFEYIRKVPDKAPELTQMLKSRLEFRKKDGKSRFYRQRTLFKMLIEGVTNGKKLQTLLFYTLSKSFMKFQFQYFQSGRNMSLVANRITLPNNQIIQQFRKSIWKTLDDNFSNQEDLSFSFLQSYGLGLHNSAVEILRFDLTYILELISNHLSKANFYHCRWVHDQLHSYSRKSIEHSSFDSIKSQFTNKLYEEYLILDHNQYRDKQDYEFDDVNAYTKLKENQIRSSFRFSSKQDVHEFYKTFLKLRSSARNNWHYNQSLEYVLDENTKNDFPLGVYFLEVIMQNDNEVEYTPFRFFKNTLTNIKQSEQIWEVINRYEYEQKHTWLISYFIYLSEDIITSDHSDQLILVVKSLDKSTSLYFNGLLKYTKYSDTLIKDILHIIAKKSDSSDNRIYLPSNLFEDYFIHLKDDLDLVKKTYLQQYKLDEHFDFSNEGLLNILKEDVSFLYEFFMRLKNDTEMRLHSRHNNMSFVWQLDGVEEEISKIIDLVMADELYFGFIDHDLNVFFARLSNSNRKRADNYLLGLIELYASDTKMMDMILDVIRNSCRDLFEPALLKYLSVNQNVKQFSEIRWRSPISVGSGDVIFAEEQAENWKSILKVVERSGMGIRLIPIKRLISDRIQSCINKAEWERKMKYISKF